MSLINNRKIRFIRSILIAISTISCKHEIDLTEFPHPKDEPPVVVTCQDSLLDIDGNVYNVIDVDGTCLILTNNSKQVGFSVCVCKGE